MDLSLLLQYGTVLIVLVGLEGLLAADNALVMAIMVKHLPEDKEKALLWFSRCFCLDFLPFCNLYLVDIWQVQH